MSTMSTPALPRWQHYLKIGAMAILTLILGIQGGIFKFVNNQMWIDRFNDFGYPLWFMYLTGVIELAAVAALWFPRTRVWGAVVIIAMMLGAAASNLRVGELFIPNLLFAALALAILWFERREMRVA